MVWNISPMACHNSRSLANNAQGATLRIWTPSADSSFSGRKQIVTHAGHGSSMRACVPFLKSPWTNCFRTNPMCRLSALGFDPVFSVFFPFWGLFSSFFFHNAWDGLPYRLSCSILAWASAAAWSEDSFQAARTKELLPLLRLPMTRT